MKSMLAKRKGFKYYKSYSLFDHDNYQQFLQNAYKLDIFLMTNPVFQQVFAKKLYVEN